jgi:hypothetical protein
MRVQELLMNIHNKEFNLERGLQVKKYLPMELKKTIAQGIMYECTSEENGITKIDSVQRYMSYVKYMITTHTNLEYTDENYDALCSTMYGDSTLLNAITNCFDADAKECLRILNLMCDDLAYMNSIEVTVGEVIYNLNNILKSFINKMENKISDMNIDDVNLDQLSKFLNIMNK